MSNYYNTTNLSGDDLKAKEKKVSTQEKAILKLFQRNPAKDFTPSEVLAILELQCPITSVRRAITNLTIAGELTRTNKKRMGDYGMNTYCWRLKFKDSLL